MSFPEDKVEILKGLIKSYPDFPTKGILFRDFFPLFADVEGFSLLISMMVNYISSNYKKVDAIMGVESRGFIMGTPLAMQLKTRFVPMRKPGKLPGEILRKSYELEYGSDFIEIQKNALQPDWNVIIVDDLIATGGTLKAAYELVEELGANLLECLVVIELLDLKGRNNLPVQVTSVVQY